LKSTKVRMLLATVVALLFVMAAPLAIAAAPAFSSLSVDRTTIQQGETVTFSVRTTAQTTHVFATVDGNRVQGIRGSGNNWSVTVAPTRTAAVYVFANDANDEHGAAQMRIPVTVGATAAATVTATAAVNIPPVPANLAPLAIHYITETPAIRSNWVRLTVVTGREVAEVWANFDRVNNARATGRFARATRQSEDANSRTWTIDFDPAVWAAQTVEIGANRAYRWEGATTQTHTLTLAQPFVTPANPRINSVSTSPNNPGTNRDVTFTIATNVDVEYVWVRDPDGREHSASRTTATATNRNWSVTFRPTRTGTHVIFANTTRTETGAARRNQSIGGTGTVDGDASIIGTPTARWVGNDRTRINVTTNRYAQTVWVVMPGENRRTALYRTNSGAGNRTWSAEVYSRASGDIDIGVSSMTGNLNNLDAEDTRRIRRTDGGSGDGEIIQTQRWAGIREVRHGDWAEFRVVTTTDIDSLDITGPGVRRDDVHAHQDGNDRDGERTWWVSVDIRSGSGDVTFRVHAYIGNNRVDSRDLPVMTIRN